MKRTHIAVAAGRFLSTTIAAGLLAAGIAGAQEPIKIGAFLSVTGPAAFLGDPEQKTLELYVEKLNAAGGVLGRKLQLVAYDSAGDAEKARTFARSAHRAGQGRCHRRRFDHRRDHGGGAAGRAGRDPVHLARRRGRHQSSR